MADVTDLLKTLGVRIGSMTASDSTTWVSVPCPHCGNPQQVMVAAAVDDNHLAADGLTKWLRCPACREGSVEIEGSIFPADVPLREPLGLPEIDARIWNEARTCLGVGANAAAVMLCRKLLFHIAVAHGLPEKNSRNRAPGFADAVKHLEAEGIVTKRMMPWVDRIKDVGNDANHELTPITPEQALDVATFTEQLLRLAYEMDALMDNPEAATDEPTDPHATITL